jgi:UDP-glucose 4-epimerase
VEIVVTGAAGYIGSHVCSELISQGYEVIAIDDLSTGKEDFLNSKVKFHKGKVQDLSFLTGVLSTLKSPKESGVIHCAGLKFAGESVKFPLSYYENNTFAVQVVLSGMRAFGINSLVFSSSCSVYGNIDSPQPARENSPLIPVSPYGRSKLFAERIIQDQVVTGILRAVVLRYFNVAGNAEGVGHDISHFNLLPNLYRAISDKRSFKVFGGDFNTKDGSCVRDYVDVSLLAKAHIITLKKLMSGESLEFAYNLGSGEGASVYEIVQAAKDEIRTELQYVTVAARTGDPAQILADTSLAKRDLAWEHSVSTREMVLSGWKAWNSSPVY